MKAHQPSRTSSRQDPVVDAGAGAKPDDPTRLQILRQRLTTMRSLSQQEVDELLNELRNEARR